MRQCFLFHILVLISVFVFAQKRDSVRNALVEKTLFSGSHFSFSVIPYLSQKAKITKESGEYALTSTIMHGIEAGGNYHINFNKNYSLVIGLHGGASARNANVFIHKEDFNPQLQVNVNDNGALTREYDFYISAPIWFEKRWQCKNKNHWSAIAGINVRFYPDDISDGTGSTYPNVNGQNVVVYEINLTIGNNYKPWINYNIGGGYSFLLKNDNFLRFNLLANFSSTKMVNGDYTITVTGKPESSGKYSANLSYLGLAIDYIFTGTNKRLRNLYEKELHYR